MEDLTPDETLTPPVIVSSFRQPKDIEKDLEKLSMDIGKQYHEKYMTEARLDQLLDQLISKFNRLLLEYKQVLDREKTTNV